MAAAQRIGLVGCVKTKGDAGPAQDLYVSWLFRGRRAWVEQTCDRWLILSALHGVIEPTAWIEPYDRTLLTATDPERRAWSRHVIEQLQALLGSLAGLHFEVHAGLEYREFGVRQGLEALGATVSCPMAHKPLGVQRALYARGPDGAGPVVDEPVEVARAPAHRRPQPGSSAGGGGLRADSQRAREVGRRLWRAWNAGGVFGTRLMPETKLPAGVDRGSGAHALFITLTVALDYMRDAEALWAAARVSVEDPETAWLFEPSRVAAGTIGDVRAGLQRHGLALRPDQDARIWQTVATSLSARFEGDPRRIAEDCGMYAPAMLREIRRADTRHRFPWLQGRKIAPLWVRMMRDELGMPLNGLQDIPIPVDVHIARTTLVTGCLTGTYNGTVDDLAQPISQVWRDACDGEDFVALQLDQALWLQSRDGCSQRTGTHCPREAECVLHDLCQPVQVRITNGQITVPADMAAPERGTPRPPAQASVPGDRGRTPGSGLEVQVWARILAHAGERGFTTMRGVEIEYAVDGQFVSIAGRNARIPRAHVARALECVPLRSLRDIPSDCWGPSYIYALLNDPRIRGKDW